MIYSPVQIAFIKFLKSSIAKNKKYGYLNLTNKEIAERFNFQQRKYSESRIKTLLSETKQYFHIENKGPARQIYLSKESCITIRTSFDKDINQALTRHKLDTNQTFLEQESLEPQGLHDSPLINKNQDQESINKNIPPIIPQGDVVREEEVNTKKEEILIDTFSLNDLASRFLKVYAFQGLPARSQVAKELKEVIESGDSTKEELLQQAESYNKWLVSKNLSFKHNPANWLKEGFYKEDYTAKIKENLPAAVPKPQAVRGHELYQKPDYMTTQLTDEERERLRQARLKARQKIMSVVPAMSMEAAA